MINAVVENISHLLSRQDIHVYEWDADEDKALSISTMIILRHHDTWSSHSLIKTLKPFLLEVLVADRKASPGTNSIPLG